MSKLLLFSWTGWAPRDVKRPNGDTRRPQVHCAIVLRSKAEFKRINGCSESQLRNYVQVWPADDPGPNLVHQAAVANPGTLYWHDNVRQPYDDNAILPYDGDYTEA